MTRNLFISRKNGEHVNGKTSALLVPLVLGFGAILLLPMAAADPFRVDSVLTDDCGQVGNSGGRNDAGVSGHSVYFSIYLEVFPYTTWGKTVSAGKSVDLNCWVHPP
ncbi:MAG: hypothetical protein QOI63_782 [Thermoplasmata archaeon]|jgi:hypothetical protein|nr:hypothetical protein [Thermoplasmata archaeon]